MITVYRTEGADQLSSEMLGDLQESFNSLEEGSRGMVAQVSTMLANDAM